MELTPKELTLKLGNILKNMYKNGENKVAYIHLFGIKFAPYIEIAGSIKEILKVADLQESYETEIRKGMKLFTSVSINSEVNEEIEKIVLFSK